MPEVGGQVPIASALCHGGGGVGGKNRSKLSYSRTGITDGDGPTRFQWRRLPFQTRRQRNGSRGLAPSTYITFLMSDNIRTKTRKKKHRFFFIDTYRFDAGETVQLNGSTLRFWLGLTVVGQPHLEVAFAMGTVLGFK